MTNFFNIQLYEKQFLEAEAKLSSDLRFKPFGNGPISLMNTHYQMFKSIMFRVYEIY